jgi:hypothetical protein
MGRYWKIIRFYWPTLIRWQTLSVTGVMAFNVLLSVLIPMLTSAGEAGATIGTSDIIALAWALSIGVALGPYGFRFLLCHGVSRRTQFIAGSLTLAVLSAMWAAIVTLLVSANLWFARTSVLFQMLYQRHDILSTLTWECAALLLFAFLGWFIYLVHHVTDRKGKLWIAAAPFVLGPILVLINSVTHGAFLADVSHAVKVAMGFGSGVPNPYVGALSILLVSLLLAGAAVYPILRTVELKES